MRCAVVVLALLPCVLALEDQVRECERLTCAVADEAESMEFDCGGPQEVITSVDFASLGEPSGTCAGNNLAASAVPDCNADGAKKFVEDACVGKPKCSVASIGGATPSGVSGCTASPLRAAVRVTCGAPGFDFFQVAISLVVALISLGMGATVELDVLRSVFKSQKRALALGFFAQFGVLPLLSFTLIKVLGIDEVVGIGVMVIASCPGGNSSNLVTYFSKGNVALSITMSAVSTLASLFMLPLLVFVYVDNALGLKDSGVEIPFVNIFTTLLLAIIPAGLGVFIKTRRPDLARKVELFGSVLGALFIVGAIIVGAVENPDLLDASAYPNIWIAAVLLLPLGALLGYGLARVLQLGRPERRAVAIETGVQNTIIALAVITLSFEGCQRLNVITYPLVASLMDPVNSIWVGALFRLHARYDDEEKEEEARISNF